MKELGSAKLVRFPATLSIDGELKSADLRTLLETRAAAASRAAAVESSLGKTAGTGWLDARPTTPSGGAAADTAAVIGENTRLPLPPPPRLVEARDEPTDDCLGSIIVTGDGHPSLPEDGDMPIFLVSA